MRENDPERMRQRLIEIVRRSRERTERVKATRKAATLDPSFENVVTHARTPRLKRDGLSVLSRL